MGVFLQVNKDYMGLGLKSIDLLIISQVEEFTRNGNQCYVTNKQFSDMFGESESSIKRAIDKLVKADIIHRDTVFVQGNGRANKQRVLNINSRKKWKVQNEPTITECKVQNDLTKEMEGSNFEMEGSKSDNGRFKNGQWKGQNDPIKDNKNINKIKIKDNSNFNFNINSNFDLKDDSNSNLDSNVSIEKKKVVINLFKKGGVKYKVIKEETGLSFDQIKQIITDYKADPDGYFYVPPVKKEIRYIGKDGNEHYIELSDIRKDLATKEETLEAQNKCLQEYCDYLIEDGADKDYVYNFFKTELNYTPEGGDKDLSDTADVSCDNVYQINNFVASNNKNKGINRFLDDKEMFG